MTTCSICGQRSHIMVETCEDCTDGTSQMYMEDFSDKIKLEQKNKKLKQLLLLTDPDLGDVEMNELTKRQWLSYIKEFPDEA